MTRFLATLLCPGDAFVDVGTHIGFFSLRASSLVGKSLREPMRQGLEAMMSHSLTPRILIYSVAFWPLIGGVQTIVAALAGSLADGEQQPDAMTVIVVTETPANPAFDKDLPFRVVRKPSWIELLRLLGQSDVVHLAGPALLPLLFCLVLRKRTVVEHHGFQAICPNGLLLYEPMGTSCPGHFMAGRYRECLKCNAQRGRWKSMKLVALTFLRRWLCNFVHANIAPTHWLESLLRLPHTSVIWHGVRETGALPDRTPGQPPTFVFLGRLVTTKGVHLLIEAARELRKRGCALRIIIIGEGPERESLERLSQALGLRDVVDFVGHLSDRDVKEVLHIAVAVVMPSVAGEVFGLVAVETMMCGRPIIVPDRGSLAEVVGNGGLKFRADDVGDLAACMERLLREPELATTLVQLSRRRTLQLFREEQMTDAHLRLYRKVIQ